MCIVDAFHKSSNNNKPVAEIPQLRETFTTCVWLTKECVSPVADGAMCYSTAFIVLAGLFMALGGHIGQYISAMTYPFAYVFSGASFQMITVRMHLNLEP